MDRKEFFNSLLGTRHRQSSSTLRATAATATGLTPYSGPWNFQTAGHLLRRTTYGPTLQLINRSLQLGLQGSIEALFSQLPQPQPPLRFRTNVADSDCALGQTWVDKPMNGTTAAQHRGESLRAWNLMIMLQEEMSIREKLTLFWMNHFGVGNNPDQRSDYMFVALLRAGAMGNFRQLVKDVTISPAMLHFLNGGLNEKGSVNENFAREILELYTIGKGPLIGPGDYTNYTELDIREMAKSFTGWRIRGWWGANGLPYTIGVFESQYHDETTKKLSSKFGNAVIPNGGDQEYAQVIDIIFRQEEVSRHICRRLYRWFCYYEIDASVETNVIAPMAKILRDNDYNIRPALTALLGSEHFFDAVTTIGPMIKNPIDFMMSVLKPSMYTLPSNWQDRYSIALYLFELLDVWQMNYFGIPSVAGWKAYHQDPLYYRMWVSSASLQDRQSFVTRMLGNGYQVRGEGTGTSHAVKLDPLPLLNILQNPSDPNAVVQELAALLLPVPIPTAQADALKNILLPGLPDFEWTVEFNQYKADPNNQMHVTAVSTRLKNLLSALFMIAENHLS